MKRQNWVTASITAAFALFLPQAEAHIGYSGRDFGSFTGLEMRSTTIANQAVTGNFGWVDASDPSLGDSHKGRAFRFHLDHSAWISLSVAANPGATATSVAGLLPGVSIYSGLAAIAPFATSQTALPSSADHDDAAASLAWRTDYALKTFGPGFDSTATDGSWNAVGDWRIGGDGDLPGDFTQLSTFRYALSNWDEDHDGTATVQGQLGAGDYTVFVGGVDLANKTSPDATLTYGLTATLTVATVPEPATWAIGGVGAVLLLALRRR
jgi:hypothetical protein